MSINACARKRNRVPLFARLIPWTLEHCQVESSVCVNQRLHSHFWRVPNDLINRFRCYCPGCWRQPFLCADAEWTDSVLGHEQQRSIGKWEHRRITQYCVTWWVVWFSQSLVVYNSYHALAHVHSKGCCTFMWIFPSTHTAGDITRFFPRIDRIFPGEALNPFFGAQDEGFSEFRST